VTRGAEGNAGRPTGRRSCDVEEYVTDAKHVAQTIYKAAKVPENFKGKFIGFLYPYFVP